MQNLLDIQNALRSAPDQQLMGLMQGSNPMVPQWAVASELNNRKEMRSEQTRQEGLGQPTVLEGLMGAAPAPTPQTNVAGMPQGAASGMAQSIAPKTNVAQNTGIASVAPSANAAAPAPVAKAASGGILKMAPGGAVNQVIVTFAEDSPIYPGETRRMTQDTLEAMPRNSVQDVKGVADVGGVEAAKKVPYLPMSGGLKRQLKTIESESFPLIDTSDRNNVPPNNYGVSAGLPPAGGAMYSSPTGGQGGNTDSSRLGLPKDEFSQVPVSSISTPKGLTTLGAAGDADMRDEAPVVDTTFLTETQRRIKESDAKRARAAFLESLAPNNAQGQPGGILGAKYPEGKGSYSTSIVEALTNNDPYSGELSPSQTARNQKTLSNTLKEEEAMRQRSDIAKAEAIAQDAADTREAFSVPFNATSDEAAKKSVSLAPVVEPGTELAVAAKTDPMQMTDTEIRNASQGLIPYDMSMAADGAQDPKPITIDSAVKPSEEVTNAQPKVSVTDRVNPFEFNVAPENTKPKKPEVFDALEDIRFAALLNEVDTVDQILIDQIKKLGTPQEQAAAIKLTSDKHITATKAEEAAIVALAEARKNDTGVYDAKKKLEAAQNETNRIERVAPWVLNDNAGKFVFGPEISKLVEAQAAQDLQADAAADVTDLTAQTAGAEDYLRRQQENKELDAEARLETERAAGLTAGENAFVAPSSADPTSNAALTAKLVAQMGKKDTPVSDDTRLNSYLNAAGQQGRAIGAAANSIGTDLKLPSYQAQLDGEFDKRVIEMRELADGIASGKYTGNGLKIAQDRIKYLNSVVETTGGAETFSEYLNDGAKKVVQSYAAPAAVNMADLVLGGGAQVALPEALGGGVDNAAATQDYLDILQRETDGKPNIPTKPSVLASNSILDAMITNDAQTQAGSAAKVDNSLGALITDGKAQVAKVPGQILTPELNDKLAGGLATVVEGRKEEISGDGALINKMWGESKLQPNTTVESQIVNAAGLTAAEQLEKDNKSGEDFLNNLPLLDQSVKNGNAVTPATRTGIATVNPMANRASDSPSSYEQKLLDILDKREKSADQDKWLGLAEMGMRLMASSNPNLLSAVGEAGLGASQTFLGNKRKDEAQEMDVLSKLSALEARKQIADDANRTRLTAAGIAAGARSGKPAAGSYASVNSAITGIRAQISAIEGSMPATPPTDSRALEAYNKQITTLSSLREQEKQLMSTNPVVASIFANVDGSNTPAAVNLSK